MIFIVNIIIILVIKQVCMRDNGVFYIFVVSHEDTLIGLQAALLGETKGNGAKAHSSGGDKPPLRRKQR